MMIRQSLVDERLSALHHHTHQSPGENSGGGSEMSKSSRRLPPSVASRVVIKKNSSLPPANDDININSLSPSPSSPTPTVDPRARIDLLERNLRFVQQQHDITLADLHNEINRLQQENRDLHFHLINIQPSSSSWQEQKSVVPSIHQLSDLTHHEPILEKRLQEVQRLHFEQQLEELRARLIETEQKNDYLTRTIDDMSKTTSRQSPPPPLALPVLLPDPNPLPETNTTRRVMINVDDDDDDQTTRDETNQMTNVDYHQLIKTAHDTNQQQKQEIAMMRAVLREILHGERLSSTTKILIRDCLAATSSGPMSARTKPTSTPMDMYLSGTATNSQPQRSVASSSTAGRTITTRQWGGGQARPVEQRLVLPPIAQGGTPSPFYDPTGGIGSLHSSLSQTNYAQQQSLPFGETSVARRERRTQELQRTRLTKNLYH